MVSTPSVASKQGPMKINLSVKFLGRFLPPPIPKAVRARTSTLKHTRTSCNIVEEDEELMDEILQDEEMNGVDQDRFGAQNISEVTNGDVNRQNSTDSAFLIG